ncbi:Protein of unknown function [Pyronema omphalodes CBS 100304]|uniref:Uncharacterized protein n=1 Tax=Pyronema omphalodes (strain CBS 100304) TaxID=1076935 RepID=U4L819_PYROM|nr:Protein of unknown function [Pyronema omphalodes CBS 100304]
MQISILLTAVFSASVLASVQPTPDCYWTGCGAHGCPAGYHFHGEKICPGGKGIALGATVYCCKA